MKIIYVPFYEESDLVTHASQWLTKNDKQVVSIIHGQELPQELFYIKDITIYVLAHGLSGVVDTTSVASSASIDKNTTFLDIADVAKRFEAQFSILKHCIYKVKLFMCNDKGTEQLLAQRFVDNLTEFQHLSVNYYRGNLFFPNTLQAKQSMVSGYFPLKSVRGTLTIKPQNKADAPMLKSIFLASGNKSRAEQRQKQKRRREQLIARYRNQQTDSVADTDPSHQEQNNALQQQTWLAQELLAQGQQLAAYTQAYLQTAQALLNQLTATANEHQVNLQHLG